MGDQAEENRKDEAGNDQSENDAKAEDTTKNENAKGNGNANTNETPDNKVANSPSAGNGPVRYNAMAGNCKLFYSQADRETIYRCPDLYLFDAKTQQCVYFRRMRCRYKLSEPSIKARKLAMDELSSFFSG